MAFAQKTPTQNNSADSNLLLNQISRLNRRLRLIEEQISTLREHTNLVENNITQKDKNTTEELNNFSEELHDFHNEINEVKQTMDQFINKLDRFASKEEVKVLKRYLDIWNPMNFLTKEEVEEIISKKLEERKNK